MIFFNVPAIFILFFAFVNVSYADECTDRVNAYINSLNEAILQSKNDRLKAKHTDNLKRISLYRQKMTDCEAQHEMLRYLYQDEKHKSVIPFLERK